MPEQAVKIYNDGGHFVGIIKGAYPAPKKRYRIKPNEEEIVLKDETISLVSEDTDATDNKVENTPMVEEIDVIEEEPTPLNNSEITSVSKPEAKIKTTRKELFERLYKKYYSLKYWQRKKQIIIDMLPYFDSEDKAQEYVSKNCERMYRNFVVRRMRLFKKVRLQEWNYFCTFTYDDKKHTEQSFRKRLMQCLQRFCSRKKWKYIGVWERGKDTNRLHFHAIMYIPEMVGELVEKKDFDTRHKKIQITFQNTFFGTKFGRADFEAIEHKFLIDETIMYMVKYIEKTGEKLVYSRGLPQYIISDIMDEDIICFLDEEERKIILSDEFGCWDEGCYIGQNTPEVLAQMPKSN